MKKYIAFFVYLLSAGPLLFAGGSIGGGSGSSLIEIDLESQSISQADFSRLVVAGLRDEVISMNSILARVKAVDFENKSVQIEIEGNEEPLYLHQQVN